MPTHPTPTPATPPPAPVPQPVASDGACTADDLLASITKLCEAYASARVARFTTEHAADKFERDQHAARASYWQEQARTQYEALAASIRAAFPDRARVEAFRPVRVLPNGHVEIHARDQHARPVVLGLTGGEAVTVGVHLTAYAAIGLDRTGNHLNNLLPPLPVTAPAATTGDMATPHDQPTRHHPATDRRAWAPAA